MNLVFDIGGTHTRLGVSPDGATIPEMVTIATANEPEKAVKEMALQVKKLIGRDRVSCICGGLAGVLDINKTRLLRSPNLRDWEKKPFKKLLEETFGAKATLFNDAVLGGLGEAVFGAGRRKQIVTYIAVGTGIGGVNIIDGKICPAAFGFEPGHQIIDFDGEVGYWEDFASGLAMEKLCGVKPEKASPSDLENETRLLALGIYNAIVFWSPEIVILGGGVMNSINIEKLTELLKEEMKIFPSIPEIAKSGLGEKSGLYGALAYLKQLNPGY